MGGPSGLAVSDYFLLKHEEVATELAKRAVDADIITCDPAVDAPACAREVLAPVMERAWRRPVTEAEVDAVLRHLDVVEQEQAEPSKFTQAIRLGIQHILMAPHFLFRFEVLPDPTATEPQPLGNYELASRLSYLVYGSMPDDKLFAAAAAGKLTNPEELEAQFMRMLADPKGSVFVDRLIGEWLLVDRLDLLQPEATLYPNYDAELRDSMKKELTLFVKEFLTEDRDFRDMLDADFTYVNDTLAKHYGIPKADTYSHEFKRVSLADVPERGGLLTQGALLSATSVPHNDPTAVVSETNVIIRGQFVLEQLVCFQLPSPPDGVDVNQVQAEAQKDIADSEPRKVREGVRQAIQPCQGCHQYLDPIGYSMEHFDITGAWRTKDFLGTPVDSTGILKGGSGVDTGTFEGARSLGTLLKEDPRVSSCLVQNVMKLAVARDLTQSDMCAADALANQSNDSKSGLRSLVLSIIKSPIFTHQQGEAP